MHTNMSESCPERIPQDAQVLAGPQVPFIANVIAKATKRAYEKKMYAVL